MAKKMVGFDIGATDAIIVDSKGTVDFRQMPNNVVNEDGIVSPDAFALFIKDFKSNAGIKDDDCAVVLPENATFYRTISCPAMSDEQIKLNLPYEFRNFIGQDAAKYNYDYMVDSVENDENGKPKIMNLTAAAGLKNIIEEYSEAFKKAGLRLKLALPKEICLINLMRVMADENKEYCLVGLGTNTTTIYIFNGSKLIATKAIDMGNRNYNRIIAEEYGIDDVSADVYRIENRENCLKHKSLKALYDKLSLEVMRTINFYRYEHNDTTLDTMYFYGTGSANDFLIKTICKQVEFEQGNIDDLLPINYKSKESADKALVSIGLIL